MSAGLDKKGPMPASPEPANLLALELAAAVVAGELPGMAVG